VVMRLKNIDAYENISLSLLHRCLVSDALVKEANKTLTTLMRNTNTVAHALSQSRDHYAVLNNFAKAVGVNTVEQVSARVEQLITVVRRAKEALNVASSTMIVEAIEQLKTSPRTEPRNVGFSSTQDANNANVTTRS
jgi:hypothetical protein